MGAVHLEYIKITVVVEDGRPRVVECRGPYTFEADCRSLREALERVFEFDNLRREDGLPLTGYLRRDIMDFVVLKWNGRVVPAYCAPVGWVVLADVPEASEVNRSAMLPHGLTEEEIRAVFHEIQQTVETVQQWLGGTGR